MALRVGRVSSCRQRDASLKLAIECAHDQQVQSGSEYSFALHASGLLIDVRLRVETCWSLSTEPLQANWVYLPSSSMLHLSEARGGPLAVVMGIPVAFADLACDTAAYPRRVGAPQTLGSVRKGRWTEESGADAFFQRFMYQDTPP